MVGTNIRELDGPRFMNGHTMVCALAFVVVAWAVAGRLSATEPIPASVLPLVQVTGIRQLSEQDSRQVIIDLEAQVRYTMGHLSNPERIYVDLLQTKIDAQLKSRLIDVVGDSLIARVRIGTNKDSVTRVVLDLRSSADCNVFELSNPTRLVIDLRQRDEGEKTAESSTQGAVEGTASEPSARAREGIADPAVASGQTGWASKPALNQGNGNEETTEPAIQGPVGEAVSKSSASVLEKVADPAVASGQTEWASNLALNQGNGNEETAEPAPQGSIGEPASESLARAPGNEGGVAPGEQEAESPAKTGANLEAEKTGSPAATDQAPKGGKTPDVSASPDEDYVIGPQDVLAIDVWREPEVSRVVPVRPDGKISLPLIGEVVASGLTSGKLQIEIAKGLDSYIRDPRVTVIIQEANSQKFYIIGEVGRPGVYPLTTNMTILDALAVAGGFRDFAKVKDIYLLRHMLDGSRKRFAFNYKAAVDGRTRYEDLALHTGDTIIVP
jgi:polysaccharide export outer membrane protein